MKILSTGQICDVIALCWIDDMKTLRAFPRTADPEAPLSYVVYTENMEETAVWCEIWIVDRLIELGGEEDLQIKPESI